MPKKIQHIRQNFGAGVVSPRMSTRVDTEAFANALRRGTNFLITPQGTAKYREGLEFVGYPASNQPFRLFQFHRGGDVADFLIEVSQGIVRYWAEKEDGSLELLTDETTILVDEDDNFELVDEDDGANLTVGVIANANPYSVEDLETLYFTNQDSYGVITHESHPPFYVTVLRNGEVIGQLLQLERIPLWSYSDVDNPQYSATTGGWQITFPDSWNTKSYFFYCSYNGVVATSSGGLYTSPFTDAAGTNEANILAQLEASAAQQGIAVSFTVTSIDIYTYTVDMTGEGSGFPVNVFPFYGYNPSGYGLDVIIVEPKDSYTTDPINEPAWSYPTMVFHDSRYWRCLQTHTSSAATTPGTGDTGGLYWEDLGIGVPKGFLYQYPNGNDWATSTAYAPWGRGFPTVAIFHQQRLILMANPGNPTALYGSRIGDYFDFFPNVNDDDPFIFVLDSSDTPEIKWAQSQRNLILGSSSGEWSIGAEITITATDIRAIQQNGARSHLSIPFQINNQIFYVEQSQRKIRASTYQRRQDGYVSVDITIMAEHLIRNFETKRVVVSKIPEVYMVAVRDNGQPVFISFNESTNVLAFTPMETSGFVYDACSYFSLASQQDWIYFVTERGNNYVIERMRYPSDIEKTVITDYTSPAMLTDQRIVHMDGWVTGDDAVGNIIGDLGHLEGQEVGILLDDAWIGVETVNGGRIFLPVDATGKKYAVGMMYDGELETFELADNFEGTGLGTKRRWLELNTRLLDSALPIIGSYRAADRTPRTPMGQSENVIFGQRDIRQHVSGYKDGSIYLLMDRPYPVHVLGFFGEYQIEDR